LVAASSTGSGWEIEDSGDLVKARGKAERRRLSAEPTGTRSSAAASKILPRRAPHSCCAPNSRGDWFTEREENKC
jgi:hypothetical protein